MTNGVLYGTGNVLGYNKVGRNFVINDEQAETIKLIFDLYEHGMSLRGLQFELERLGRKTAMGNTKWYSATIHHIITNPIYCGTLVYRKQISSGYLEQHRLINKDDSSKIVVENGDIEPLITVEQFSRVQEILKSNSKKVGNNIYRGQKPCADVWSTKLLCGCGAKYHRASYKDKDNNMHYNYRCYNQIKTGNTNVRLSKGLPLDNVCDNPSVPEWKLQLMVNIIFQKLNINYRKNILSIAKDTIWKHKGNKNEITSDKHVNAITKEISKCEIKLNNLLDMRIDGEIDKPTYLSKRVDINNKMCELKAELDTYNNTICADEKNVLIENSLINYIDYTKYNVPKDIISIMVDKIIVNENKLNWYLKSSVQCFANCYSRSS